MLLMLKSSVVATLIATLLCAPLSLYGYRVDNPKSTKPSANITQANAALLNGAVAAKGTTVYPGDTLQTDPTGSLQMQARGAQIRLFGSSQTKLENDDPGLMRVSLNYGTIKFSSVLTTNFRLTAGMWSFARGPGFRRVGRRA